MLTQNPVRRLLDLVGNTPLIRIERVLPEGVPRQVEVYVKAEWMNPGGSVKDRAALGMVTEAMAAGRLGRGQILIDSTSGNTGIAYAMIGAALGFPVELVMPHNVSAERKQMIKAYGARVHYSDPLEGSDGARVRVAEIVAGSPDRYFFPDQYSNDANWKAHYRTTGPEIWRDTRGAVTHFVAGLGTSGTLTGTGRFLKEQDPAPRVIALQPEAFHGIEGWKHMESAKKVSIYDPSVHDEKLVVQTEPAYYWARELARREGILVGPSVGAALAGTLEVVRGLERGVVVFIGADGGDKYLSTNLWDS